ncbi:MBL fold metallo-hydrolase [Paenibacillus typhae]|uniref:MBL fold metallo-hydrolase n=1 Tax=Paenibacillus typhae TaxID=1174501 RepID=UPI001C8E0DE7|nr:MBL fold metallo-hydrolase [Paenibacillus typhae]MBY0013953.1 MBL fold metallo-hydrolase [Paenibacillus typhae]
MTVQLQMLGTGDAHATNYYNNNGLLLSPGYTLMIDCGTTAPMALEAAGRSFREIDAVLITHTHSDHVGGLPELARLTHAGSGRKMTLLAAGPLIEPLRETYRKSRSGKSGSPRSLDEAFEVTPLKPSTPYTLSAGVTLELISTPHIRGKDSYSLLLNGDIFYSADMIFQPEFLLKLVRRQGVRKIFHECQLTGQGTIHTALSDLLTLPQDVRSLISLMHYSDQKPEFEGKTAEMTFMEQQVIYPL